METGKSNKPNSLDQESKDNGNNLPGHLVFPGSEDIYNICEKRKILIRKTFSRRKSQPENIRLKETLKRTWIASSRAMIWIFLVLS